jgi:hypothetical protein
MTIPSSSDDLASTPLLDDRTAAQSVVEKFWETQNDQAPRGPVARLFGRSPLSGESRPWYVGALGEIEVAESLRALSTRGESWRVLHSVPVGSGASDIDHVVIGPAGVFTLNTKNHPGKKIWVGEHVLLVDGHKTAYLRNSRHEAQRASILLATALGSPVPVKPLVVVVGAAAITVKQQPVDVAVVPAARIERYLRKQKPVYSVDEVRELTRAALKPRTWQPRPPKPAEERAGSQALPTQLELQSWFIRVRSEVDAARRVQSLWAVGSAAVLLAAVLGMPTLIQGLLG